MSRIGKMPVNIPAGVTVTVDENNLVVVKGPKGTLEYKVPAVIHVAIDGAVLNVTRENEEKTSKQLHGTVRANIHNMVVGCSEGYSKKLIMKGTGYHSESNAKEVTLYVGYSHPIKLPIPAGVEVKCGGQNNTEVVVSGYDKQKVGQLAALIRGTRLPEPYLGKGVAYENEHIRRKEGKKAGKK